MLNQAKVELQDKVKKPQLIHINWLPSLFVQAFGVYVVVNSWFQLNFNFN